MELHDVIAQTRKWKPSLLEVEAFHLVLRGSQEVQNSLGGLNNPKLAHLFRAEVRKNLTIISPTIVLPSDAGVVLRAEIDDVPVDVLPAEQESAIRRNYLYNNSAIRRGNEVRFYNLYPSTVGVQKNQTARIVYETTFQTPIFVDGFYARFIKRSYSSGGVQLKVLEVMFPEGEQFPNDYLRGATLRLYDNEKQARDWSVFTNYFMREDDGANPPDTTQKIVLNNDMNHANANFPGFSLYQEKGYPIRIMRLSLPPVLREAIVLWIKYELSSEQKFKRDYEIFLQQYQQS